MDQPKVARQERDFAGLVLEVDERDLPPGASPDMVNIFPEDTGLMRSRLGYRVCTFEDD